MSTKTETHSKKAGKFTRFRNRFVSASMIAGLLPALVLSLLFIYNTRASYRRELTDAYRLALTRLESSVNSMLEYLCQNTMNQLILNNKLQTILIGDDEDGNGNVYMEATSASREIGKYQQATGMFVELLRVYTILPDKPLYGLSIAPLENAKDEPWYKAYISAQSKSFFYHTKYLSNPLRQTRYPTLTLVQPIICTDFYSKHYGQSLGLARMDISMDELLSGLLYGELDTLSGITAAYSPDGKLLFISNPSYEELLTNKAFPLLTDIGDGFAGLTMSAPDAYLVTTRTSRYGIRLLMLFEQEPIFTQLMRIVISAVCILGLSLLTVVLVSMMMSRQYSRRMETLFSKMKLVRHGVFTFDEPPLNGTDELAVLDEQFNYMVCRLRETINHNYVLELDKKDAQLRALQLQINPHFLYNTLESLNAITLMRGQTDVSDALEKLGRLFRYGVTRESRDQVTVREEIAHVDNYISIQQLRFQNKFEVFYNVPPEINDLQIPFFILQPIVENALLHGLTGDTGGTIEVSAYVEGGDLCLSVEDDGVGMSKAQCDALRERINDCSYNATSSIGLQNVHSRLRLIYGSSYGLTIDSTLGRGTRVVARIPISTEIGKGDEPDAACAGG